MHLEEMLGTNYCTPNLSVRMLLASRRDSVLCQLLRTAILMCCQPEGFSLRLLSLTRRLL